MNNKHFINTTDSETAEMLRSLGFEELEKSGNRWVFVNKPDEKLVGMFSSGEKPKLVYTNVLTY